MEHLFEEEQERRNEEEWNIYKQKVSRTGSILGFSLAALFFLNQGIGVLIVLLSAYLSSHQGVTGLGDEILKILTAPWFSVAGSGLLAYALVLPIVKQIMKLVPEERAVKKKMRIKKFFMFFVLAMGSGYILNLIGSAINLIIAIATGRNFNNMTPLNAIFEEMNLATAIYVGVLGPLIEEYIFRGLLLNRLRPFGEKTAILFSGIMFGMMHGNLAQMLYATAIGIIFGYVAVKTGRLLYNSILHVMVNSYSVLFIGGIVGGGLSAGWWSVFATVALLPLLTLGSIIASIVILCIKLKKIKLLAGNCPNGMTDRDYVVNLFVNPGVITFVLLCIGMAYFYAFWA